MNVDGRPTIHTVLELLDNTEFVYLDHKDTVEGNTTFFEKLNGPSTSSLYSIKYYI